MSAHYSNSLNASVDGALKAFSAARRTLQTEAEELAVSLWSEVLSWTHELGLSAAGVNLGPAALLHGLAVEGGTGGVESGAGEHCGYVEWWV